MIKNKNNNELTLKNKFDLIICCIQVKKEERKKELSNQGKTNAKLSSSWSGFKSFCYFIKVADNLIG